METAVNTIELLICSVHSHIKTNTKKVSLFVGWTYLTSSTKFSRMMSKKGVKL